jgi:hypothetical protein
MPQVLGFDRAGDDSLLVVNAMARNARRSGVHNTLGPGFQRPSLASRRAHVLIFAADGGRPVLAIDDMIADGAGREFVS